MSSLIEAGCYSVPSPLVAILTIDNYKRPRFVLTGPIIQDVLVPISIFKPLSNPPTRNGTKRRTGPVFEECGIRYMGSVYRVLGSEVQEIADGQE